MSRGKNNGYIPNRPNFWGFLQNVLIAAVNKGQLPLMGAILFLLIFAIRLPANEIVKMIDKLLDISKISSILGWVLFGIVTLGSYSLLKWQRSIHSKEIKRISDEKKVLQEKLSNKKLPSSNA